ncbi:serine/threonine-protein phosphatase [Streptomyces sp. NBC_01571]|uniref:ATP-binding SpoIIE family protein phosphatase n=1 Tax=Streptomyces sp. NBC_01571 TaxID=2975883 RepID=UPI0022590FA5|nr:ATP-binding SpoIIE family protein phosphatase [Streptomyces sp. NBC_01571]MCX4572116.1 serine/threonine-protein phosphatase [Streptomyces sp. NBC_01571]
MAATRLNRWLFVLLIVYIAGSCAVQLQDSAGGLVRWSGFSVLVPVTAAALLPMRRSLIIGLATLAASIVTYGFAIHGVSAGGRTVVITAVALSFALGLVVCRLRARRPNTPATVTRNRSCPPDPADSKPRSTPEAPHAVRVPPPGILPAALPQPAVVELAGHCRTGSGRLGMRAQWLDAIPLSGARVGLVAGAVTGPDAAASELRAAVRTLADVDLQPEELLAHLADVLARLRPDVRPSHDTQTAGTSTVRAQCLYAVYDPASCRCTIACAGSPAPAVITPDGTVTSLDLRQGPPLGQTDLPFEATEIDLPEGSTLLLYTHSDADAPDSGRDELLSALARPERCLDATCRSAVKALLHAPHTQVAVLAVRTHALDTRTVATWDLPADPAAVSYARSHIAEKLDAWGLTDAAPTTELIVSELVTNAIRHAQPPIQLRLIHHAGSLVCEVADGSSTSPHLRRARTFDENGRGLFIVAQLAERWGTRHSPHGKIIWAEHTHAPDQPTTTA